MDGTIELDAGEGVIPDKVKPHLDISDYSALSAKEVPEVLGDGAGDGTYRMDDKTLCEFYELAVGEIADLLRDGWTKVPQG